MAFAVGSVAVVVGCSGSVGNIASGVKPSTLTAIAPPPAKLSSDFVRSLAPARLGGVPVGVHILPPNDPNSAIAAASLRRLPASLAPVNDVEVLGTVINAGGNYTGLYAQHSAYSATAFPLSYPAGGSGSQELFAPLTLPTNRGCLSSGTVALNTGAPGANYTFFVVYDYCGPNAPRLVAGAQIDDPNDTTHFFKNNYLFTNQHGLPIYATLSFTTDVTPTVNSTWYMLLYNFTSGNWNLVFQDTGLSSTTYGYSVYESLYLKGPCPLGLPAIGADFLELYDPVNGFELVTPTMRATTSVVIGPSSATPCFQADQSGSATDVFAITQPNWAWTVNPAPLTVAVRPIKAGDNWSYSGTSTLTQVFARSTPTPIATTVSQVAQNVSVTGNAAFNGQSGLFDVRTVETDTAPLQTSTITTDNFMNTVASGGGSNLISWGYTSSDTFGESLNVQYGAASASSILLDKLPEVSGANWSNNTAERINETSPGNQTAVRTYAADGSYTDTTTFPNSSQFTPAPAPQTATIVENADGSGTYSVPFFGGANQTISYSTPSPSNIITVTFPGPSLRTATVWYPLPLHLYTETDTNNGPTSIPGACNVPATFGTMANALALSTTRVDTILGTVETIAQTTYVIPTYGAACVQLTDTLTSYYDFTGGAPGIKISSTALETQTVVTTLGLTNSTILSNGRVVLSDGSAAGWRIANARANFLASIERRRIQRQRKFFDTVQRTLRDGGRR